MGFSSALRSNLPANTSPKLFSLRFSVKQNRPNFIKIAKTTIPSRWIVKSALNGSKPKFNDNGATEPARILLERLFAQTQKLEEEMSGDSQLPKDVQPGFNLEILESDLLAVLEALRKKEEDLQHAEKQVLSEHNDLNRAKEELEQREKEIAVAYSKHEKLEGEVKEANLNLAFQARQIEDLKLQLKEREEGGCCTICSICKGT
ncbi:hypothetical protein GH714_023558 [Hevea brasiliensis]|uniref:Uncharacterized protein n=1 Tax=Hevea brasiliensis TaxID=3981 RepID=A0A6A6LUK2_HEVBR|nr:hypothetical protein GH714_023558 [Hevea brasiliensis]